MLIVSQYYEEHYQSKQPIPATHLGELMRLILKENCFKFNDKPFLQTHGIAMGTKMAVAFAVIFMAHIAASPQKPIIWKRFIDHIFSVWTFPKKKSATSLISPIHSTPRSNSPTKCHRKNLFSLILKFPTELSMFKHITSLQKRSNSRTSLQVKKCFIKG